MNGVRGIVVVKREDLVEYLKTTKADAWTEEAWNNLFDELMSSILIVED